MIIDDSFEAPVVNPAWLELSHLERDLIILIMHNLFYASPFWTDPENWVVDPEPHFTYIDPEGYFNLVQIKLAEESLSVQISVSRYKVLSAWVTIRMLLGGDSSLSNRGCISLKQFCKQRCFKSPHTELPRFIYANEVELTTKTVPVRKRHVEEFVRHLAKAKELRTNYELEKSNKAQVDFLWSAVKSIPPGTDLYDRV